MNSAVIFFIIHFIVFIALVMKDIKIGVIKTAALSDDKENTTPFSVVLMDFFWEFLCFLYLLLIIGFACSILASAINKFFRKLYKREEY